MKFMLTLHSSMPHNWVDNCQVDTVLELRS